MRVGQGIFPPGVPLPIVPPLEQDELISSWLDRTARFYGQPAKLLLRDIDRSAHCVEFSDVDLGMSRAPLRPVATLLGIDVDQVVAQTIAAAYPWAINLVARGQNRGRLRYAACPLCLEQQRLERGVSWLRRIWVLAPRTVCAVHHMPLVGEQPNGVAHPVWSEFLGRHRRVDLPMCANPAAPPVLAVSSTGLLPATGPVAVLHQKMAVIQEAILAEAASGHCYPRERADVRAPVVSDLVWALTRMDRYLPDRLAYETFASEFLDNPWHMARRRRPGPIDFNTMLLDERYVILATAIVLSDTPQLREAFYQPASTWRTDLRVLHDQLQDPDRSEFIERQRQWKRA